MLPQSLEESLQFQRMYAAVLHTLLSNHTQYVLDPQSTYYLLPDAVRTLTVYVTKMLTVLEQSSSLRLPADVIKDWVKIYRDKMVTQCVVFREVAMKVLHGKYTRLFCDLFWCMLMVYWMSKK